MPVRGLLIGVGSPEHRLLLQGPSRKLQADRQTRLRKTAWDSDRREPVQIEGAGVLGQQSRSLLLFGPPP